MSRIAPMMTLARVAPALHHLEARKDYSSSMYAIESNIFTLRSACRHPVSARFPFPERLVGAYFKKLIS